MAFVSRKERPPMDVPSVALRREPGALTRSLVALQLRVGLGLVLLMAGLGKFEGIKKGTYPASITGAFEGKRLPGVALFAAVLPYVEVGLGCALTAGLLTPVAATLSGVLLLHLLFGKLVLNDIPSLPGMLTYLLLNAAVLWLSPVTSNYVSFDGLFFGWFWRPRTEGYYYREEDVVRF
jgi:uncharacterized membrane protein YphA (DoxX/SURF4 family)